jgi:hypothetical protein
MSCTAGRTQLGVEVAWSAGAMENTRQGANVPTAATLTTPASWPAAFSYSGARFLQCPHHLRRAPARNGGGQHGPLTHTNQHRHTPLARPQPAHQFPTSRGPGHVRSVKFHDPQLVTLRHLRKERAVGHPHMPARESHTQWQRGSQPPCPLQNPRGSCSRGGGGEQVMGPHAPHAGGQQETRRLYNTHLIEVLVGKLNDL